MSFAEAEGRKKRKGRADYFLSTRRRGRKRRPSLQLQRRKKKERKRVVRALFHYVRGERKKRNPISLYPDGRKKKKKGKKGTFTFERFFLRAVAERRGERKKGTTTFCFSRERERRPSCSRPTYRCRLVTRGEEEDAQHRRPAPTKEKRGKKKDMCVPSCFLASRLT